MLIGPDQKCACAASRIKNFVILMFHAEFKDQVNHIGTGEILPEIMPLFLGNKSFEYPADNIKADF